MKRVGIFLLFLLILLYPLLWEDQLANTWPISAAILLVGGGAWLVVRWRSGVALSIPKISLAFMGFLVYQGVTLLRSPLPLYGLRWILFQLALIFIFILVVDTSRDWRGVQRWEKILIAAAIFFAGFSLVAMLAWYSSWWKISGGGFSLPPVTMRSNGIFFFHPNMFAAYLNLAIPLVLVRVLHAADRSRRILWLEGLLVLLLAEYFTSSRGGWLGLAASIVTVLALFYIPGLRRSRETLRGSSGKRTISLAVAGLALALVVLVPLVIYQLRTTPHGKLDWRVSIWEYAVDLIKDSPVFGQGLGALPFFYANRLEAYGVDEVFHAHNLWLQVGGETGLLGLLLLVGALLLLGKGYLSAWKNTLPDQPERAALAAYGGVLAGLLVHSLVDVPIRSFSNGLSLAIILALVYHRAAVGEFFIVKPRPAITILAAVLLLYGGIMLVYRQGDLTAWKAVMFAREGDWQNAGERLCKAASGNPTATFMGFQCALAQAEIDYTIGIPQAREAALAAQQAALNRDPYWYIHWANLASYEWENGEHASAIRHMQKALEIAPNRWLLWLNLAIMEEQVGQVDAARQHFHQAYCLNSPLADSLLMRQNPLRMEAVESTCSRSSVQDSPDPFSLAMESGMAAWELGETSLAETAFEEARNTNPRSPLPYAYLALARQALGEREQAERDLQASLFITPGSPDTLFLAAEYARREGDSEQEMDYLQQVYRLMAYPDFSWWYYQPAYSRKSLPANLSPYLVTAALTAEQRDQLLSWVAELQKRGDTGQAEQARRWVEGNSNR